MRVLRVALAVVAVLVVAAGAFLLWSQRAEIAAIEPPARASFDHAQIERGAQLAAIGNCGVCHTMPGGPAYAGNRAIPTPFGTIYSSNITPDAKSGIGGWSETAFRRAMREGIARDGRHLYPAFPYDHYAKATEDDIGALYAFVMTRTAADSRPPKNALPFPFDQRWLLAFWNLLYLDRTPFRPDPRQSAEWNRGAYLVDGLGHCGDCHTPRNLFGAEKDSQRFAGGDSEGWAAPALNATSPAPVPWDADHLFAYLRRGWDAEHGAAAGPMQPVTADLAEAAEADVRAIAVYTAALQGEPSAERRQRATELLARVNSTTPPPPGRDEGLGATLFDGACAGCHHGPGMVPPRGIDLALSSVVNAPDPRNAIFIVLDGIRSPENRSGPWMPRFAGAFTDAQLAALLSYLRARFSGGPAWTDLEGRVREIRQSRERS